MILFLKKIPKVTNLFTAFLDPQELFRLWCISPRTPRRTNSRQPQRPRWRVSGMRQAPSRMTWALIRRGNILGMASVVSWKENHKKIPSSTVRNVADRKRRPTITCPARICGQSRRHTSPRASHWTLQDRRPARILTFDNHFLECCTAKAPHPSTTWHELANNYDRVEQACKL